MLYITLFQMVTVLNFDHLKRCIFDILKVMLRVCRNIGALRCASAVPDFDSFRQGISFQFFASGLGKAFMKVYLFYRAYLVPWVS